jgi:lipoate-protein ligase B
MMLELKMVKIDSDGKMTYECPGKDFVYVLQTVTFCIY